MKSLILCLVVAVTLAATGDQWSYDGHSNHADKWGTFAPVCGTKAATEKQSPIDITGSSYDSTLGSLTLSGTTTIPVGAKLTNKNGYTVQLDVPTGHVQEVTFKTVKYKLAQIHFHWGDEDCHGSEHTIGGQKFPLEMHLVHYKSTYADLATAAGKTDGLAVIGQMFKKGTTTATQISSLFGQMGSVSAPNATVNTTGVLNTATLLQNLSKFFNYKGSLTTPNCNESVQWLVLDTVLDISAADLARFRGVQNALGPLQWNYRPVQPLNGRALNKSFNTAVTSYTAPACTFTKIGTFAAMPGSKVASTTLNSLTLEVTPGSATTTANSGVFTFTASSPIFKKSVAATATGFTMTGKGTCTGTTGATNAAGTVLTVAVKGTGCECTSANKCTIEITSANLASNPATVTPIYIRNSSTKDKRIIASLAWTTTEKKTSAAASLAVSMASIVSAAVMAVFML